MSKIGTSYEVEGLFHRESQLRLGHSPENNPERPSNFVWHNNEVKYQSLDSVGRTEEISELNT